jgi:peptidoglycan-associated lipoprotein
MTGVAVVIAFVFLVGAGCSKQAVQSGAGDQALEQGAGKSGTAPQAGSSTTPVPSSGMKEGTLGEKTVPGLLSEAPGTGGRPTEPLSGLEPVQPGGAPSEERLKDGTLVAKAPPSDAVRSQVERMQREDAATVAAGLEDVYFAFDSWKLTEEGKQALGKAAQWLKTNGERRVTIEGHCDERGTAAYNMVLGSKRAKVVESYLQSFGVNELRLTVTSFGKERPVCKEQEESCYRLNRRAHLVVRTK